MRDHPSAEISLRGYQAITLILSEKPRKTSGRYLPQPGAPDTEYPCMQEPQLEYFPEFPLEAAVTEWNVEICSCSGDNRKQLRNVRYAAVRDLFGTELPYVMDMRRFADFDRAPRLPSAYPVQAVYSAQVMLSAADVCLVTERESFCGDCEIYINGKNLPKDSFHAARIYDCENRVSDVGFSSRGKKQD